MKIQKTTCTRLTLGSFILEKQPQITQRGLSQSKKRGIERMHKNNYKFDTINKNSLIRRGLPHDDMNRSGLLRDSFDRISPASSGLRAYNQSNISFSVSVCMRRP